MEEFNFKCINTQNLWKDFEVHLRNLSIEGGELRLSSTHVYESEKEIINNAGLDMRDIAVDECDTVYIIDKRTETGKTNKILTYEAGSGVIDDTGILPLTLESPSGIGVDQDTVYIADTHRLIALARNNLQIRWILSTDHHGAPLNDLFDLTVAGGVIYAMERCAGTEEGIEKRILMVNRAGNVISQPISMGVQSDPTDIAVDKDGDIYVLDTINGKGVVKIFRKTDTAPGTIDIGFLAKGLTVDANKQIFVGEPADGPAKEKTIYKISKNNAPVPLWSYRGAAGRLITDSKNNLFILDNTGKRLVFLKYRKTNLLNPDGLYSGYYISKPINSANTKTRWHRFLLEGKFEEGTQVEFSYYISNNLKSDEAIKSLPEDEWNKGLPGASSIQGKERRDALFQKDIEGQYLWFKITLTGSETLSPALKSLTVFFPRMSYLDYLPAIYQEDPVSKEFLERFLSIFESIFYEIDFKVEHLSRFFDAHGTPPEFISWLGSWLSIAGDENFPEEMKRLYIRSAISLYKKRGTREGLEEAIALFLYTKKYPNGSFEDITAHYKQEKPFIVENFSIKRVPQDKKHEKCLEVKDLYFPPYDTKAYIKKPYTFNWYDIPGEDSDKLKQYLKDKFSINWLDSAYIQKADSGNAIKIYSDKKDILLIVDPGRPQVIFKFDSGKTEHRRSGEIINGRLRIYEKEEVRLSDILFGKEPFCFCVFLADADLSEDTVNTIRRIIDEQKPAHTCYGLKVLEPWFYLDMHTYLGMNTRLTCPAFIIGSTSALGRDTVLYDTEHAGQVRAHSRVGVDIKLT